MFIRERMFLSGKLKLPGSIITISSLNPAVLLLIIQALANGVCQQGYTYLL